MTGGAHPIAPALVALPAGHRPLLPTLCGNQSAELAVSRTGDGGTATDRTGGQRG